MRIIRAALTTTLAVTAVHYAHRAALACSGTSELPALVSPRSGAQVQGSQAVLLLLNGFSNTEEHYLVPYAPQTVPDLANAVPLTFSRMPRNSFGDAVLLVPVSPLRSGVLYQVIVAANGDPRPIPLGTFEVTSDAQRAPPSPPNALTWFDEALAEPSRDSCNARWRNALHLEIEGPSEDLLMYEVTTITADGERSVAAFLPSAEPPARATGIMHVPTGALAACVEVRSVDRGGQLSEPLRTCRPDKCFEQAEGEQTPFVTIDWSEVEEGCNLNCELAPERCATGPEGELQLDSSQGCSCSASDRERSPSAWGLLLCVFAALLRRQRPSSLRMRPAP